ncbi:hypothetical protein KIN20_010885 [Parelaphostrongylus tenuis]|uniref:Uncharacterized protein n=1 Tax=Parelaphostrongylus tenuis TaxID=148309 RepID=A0AAD5MZM2_PARTN|nr:hypothetical protein KIN20_010885 [Parelaphostrongylus tenuis]
MEMLVLQIVEVLEQQGRSAGLPDAIISSILNQLMVQINYDPLECKTVTVNQKANEMLYLRYVKFNLRIDRRRLILNKKIDESGNDFGSRTSLSNIDGHDEVRLMRILMW